MTRYETYADLLRTEPLPAALVDLDAFDRNLATLADIVREAGGRHRLRVASKSVRVPDLLRRIVDRGAPYQGLMCYAAREAAFLAKLGFDDLLVAYPTVQPTDLALLRAAHEAGKRLLLMVDCSAGLEAVSQAMAGAEPEFGVVLDVDMSLRRFAGRVHLGVRRSPVREVETVLDLFDLADRLPGVRMVGLMGYEAQVAGLGDQNPFRRLLNPIARLVRQRSVRDVAHRRRAIARALTERGIEIELFNGGGTGSVHFTVQEPWLTELTVGSGFLASHLFDYFTNVRLEPACFFALQVTRFSDAGFATCHGGGYIASGEPGWDKVPIPYLPAGLRLVGTEGCGEVQTPIRLPAGRRLKLGDPVLFRHAKAGELAEHFSEYLLISGGTVVDRAPTYRGLGQAFL